MLAGVLTIVLVRRCSRPGDGCVVSMSGAVSSAKEVRGGIAISVGGLGGEGTR